MAWGPEELGHLRSLTLTDSLGVPEVLLRLCVWLQLLTLIADVDPFVFHDLLQESEKDREGEDRRQKKLGKLQLRTP